MSSGIFVKVESGGQDPKLRPRRHGGVIHYKGDLDPDKYASQAFNPGSEFGGATVVPRMADFGGVLDPDRSDYGMVVQGQTVSGDASAGTLRTSEFAPDPESWTGKNKRTRSEDELDELAVEEEAVPESFEVKDAKESEKEEPPKQQEDSTSAPERNVGDKLESLLDEMRDNNLRPSREELAESWKGESYLSPIDRPGAMDSQRSKPDLYKPASATKVLFNGPFGTYRGTYRHVYVSPDFITLVYDQDAAVYSPPPADTLFTVSCGDKEYEVYFMGIEFDMPCLDGGVQVMIRNK